MLYPQVVLVASLATEAPFFPVNLLLSLLYLYLSVSRYPDASR